MAVAASVTPPVKCQVAGILAARPPELNLSALERWPIRL